MVSAISYSMAADRDEAKEKLINKIVGSDIVFWAATKFIPRQVLQVLGVRQEVQATFSQTEWDQVAAVYTVMLPPSDRFKGVLLDQAILLSEDFVEMIKVPTLVFHALDDTLVDFSNAEHSVAGIEGATLVQYETGGHFLLGNVDDIQAQIKKFLSQID
jgi:pimeloyl-ACP methyl ester carboxylesterase